MILLFQLRAIQLFQPPRNLPARKGARMIHIWIMCHHLGRRQRRLNSSRLWINAPALNYGIWIAWQPERHALSRMDHYLHSCNFSTSSKIHTHDIFLSIRPQPAHGPSAISAANPHHWGVLGLGRPAEVHHWWIGCDSGFLLPLGRPVSASRCWWWGR